MKTPFKSITASITLLSCLLFLFSDCNIVPVSNLQTLEATYIGRDTFVVKAGSAAGMYSVEDKVIAKNFDELLDIKYGKIGTGKRDEFEEKAQYFVISEILREGRKEAKMTQEQLANKVGTKKSYISRLENGKCDIQLSTLYRIFEFGLGKRVNLLIG